MHLFCFGTLMDPDIRGIVLGRTLPDHQIRRAGLPDFRRVSVPEEAYPAAVPTEGARVEGLAVGPITALERERVQFLEGFEFALEEHQIEVDGRRIGALACITTDRLSPDAGAWDFGLWQREDKPRFMEAATTYMATFRRFDIEDAHALWVENRGPAG